MGEEIGLPRRETAGEDAGCGCSPAPPRRLVLVPVLGIGLHAKLLVHDPVDLVAVQVLVVRVQHFQSRVCDVAELLQEQGVGFRSDGLLLVLRRVSVSAIPLRGEGEGRPVAAPENRPSVISPLPCRPGS